MPKAGQQIGSFRIIAPLGAGGIGAVWRAEDVGLSRQDDGFLFNLPVDPRAGAAMTVSVGWQSTIRGSDTAPGD